MSIKRAVKKDLHLFVCGGIFLYYGVDVAKKIADIDGMEYKLEKSGNTRYKITI